MSGSTDLEKEWRQRQAQTPYLDAILGYASTMPTRLNVPGHKGGLAADEWILAASAHVLDIDVSTLIEGVDIGPGPTGLALAQQLAAEAWGAQRSWFLTNGSSQGNHVAALTLAQRGRRVIVQRNAHLSVVTGLVLAGLEPVFVLPELDARLGVAHCVTPATLERALNENPGVVGVLLSSPTYFGSIADIAALVALSHEHGALVAVDEAWGAHLAFSGLLPASALSLGADLVVTSPHKTVGSLTQSAIIHLGRGSSLPEEIVDRSLTLIETTSPSALLTASLDTARANMVANGEATIASTLSELSWLRGEITQIPGLRLLDEGLAGHYGVVAYDTLKIVLDCSEAALSGFEIADRLAHEEHVMIELATEEIIIAIFGANENSASTVRKFLDALHRIFGSVTTTRAPRRLPPELVTAETVVAPREAFLGPQEAVALKDAAGRVSAETISVYPPGIPNILPGERITEEVLEYIDAMRAHGSTVHGAADRSLKTIRVVA